jgi:hypothetical protein
MKHRDARRALTEYELASLARLAHAKACAAYRQAADARKLTAQLLEELEGDEESDTWRDTDANNHQDKQRSAA